MERIEVSYRLDVVAAEAEDLAGRIALEQTVELPAQLIEDELGARVFATVETLGPWPGERSASLLVLGYPAWLASHQLPALLNLIFGNVSIYPGVRLESVNFPDSFLENFMGPAFGVEGIRKLVEAPTGPMLATAIKPRGLNVDAQAALASAFAQGGGHLIKDDQNLVDDDQAGFEKRIRAIATAVETSRRDACTQYFPHVAAPFEELDERLAAVKNCGLHGVLLSPMILGLDTARGLCAQHQLAFMAHPSFSGSFILQKQAGIHPAFLWGSLMRLAGADISIFPHRGGRFSLEEGSGEAVAKALREPLHKLAPALPAPAGGMAYDDLGNLAGAYGPDTLFLLGGSLLSHGLDLARNTRAFRERLAQ